MAEGGSIRGEIDNGHLVQFKIGRFFDGEAGLRVREDGSEVAYRGKTPPQGKFPHAVTIDGEAAVATGSRETSLKGWSVVLVDWKPPASA